jgi:2-(1,2-epoxy-1,2-dihydrophenyl)acetyl-CoA isomerase
MLMEPIDADRALDWGLAWRAVPDEALMAEARALAERLAEGPPLAYAAMKRQLQAATRLGLREMLQIEAEAQDALIRTADAQAAIAAYRARERPRFEGR